MNEINISNKLKELVSEALATFDIRKESQKDSDETEKKRNHVFVDESIHKQVNLGTSMICPFSLDSEAFSETLMAKAQNFEKIDAYGSFDFHMEIDGAEFKVRHLNSHDNDDAYEGNNLFSTAFLVNNHCYIIDVFLTHYEKHWFDLECSVSVEPLDFPMECYFGKRALYTYPKLGASIRFHQGNITKPTPAHRDHAQAANWASGPRHFYLTRDIN